MSDLPEKEPRAMGRPRKGINWLIFDALCAVQCTRDEIASYFHVSADTIERRVRELHNMTFAQYFATHRGAGYASLRRKQYQLALKGNPALLIWLGKQWLGQADRARTEITGADGGAIAFTDADGEAVRLKLARLRALVGPGGVPGVADGNGNGGAPG